MSRNSFANHTLSQSDYNPFPEPSDKSNVSVIIVPIVLLVLFFGILGWFFIKGCQSWHNIEASIALAQAQTRQANSLSQGYVPVEISLSDRQTKIVDTLIVQIVEIDQHLEVGESRASISKVNSLKPIELYKALIAAKAI